MENNEFLRCENIGKASKHVELKHIHLNIYDNEFISFYGLNDQTIPTLISILVGVQEPDYGSIYYAEKYHPSSCKIDTRLFRNTRMIKDLSIAENIGIIGPTIQPFSIFSTNKNEHFVREIFKEFKLDYNPFTTISKLSIVEIYILEILHIYISGGKAIFLMDFYLFNEKEQKEILDKILYPLKEKGIIFVFVNYSVTHVMYISDRIFIFNEGRLCKTLYKGEFSIRGLNSVFSSNLYSDSMILNYKKLPYGNDTNPVLEGDIIPLDISNLSPQVTGLFLDNNFSQNLKELLLTTISSSTNLDLLTLTGSKLELLIKKKIYIVSEKFENLLFNDLSVHENITITKLRELSFFKLIINTHFYHYLIKTRREYSTHLNIYQPVKNISHFDRFCILLDRILILKTNVVIINFPHTFCDSKELLLLEDFIERLKSNNTHVVILSDNYIFLQKCCDDVLIYTDKNA